jgi:hypothetical protein
LAASRSDIDRDVRLHIYGAFVASGRPPTAAETASALGRTEDEVEDAYRRLEEARVIVLAPGTLNVWMANPLSAVPTPFRVETARGSFWGSCVWDALGVVAMLGREGRVSTFCPDCGEPIAFVVRNGELGASDCVAHFAVPAARWWENIGFT